MDTENFLLERRLLLERLADRRSHELTSYPFHIGSVIGLQLPLLARWALSLVPRGGLVSSLMQIGLPLAATFFLKKKTTFLSRILSHFVPSRS